MSRKAIALISIFIFTIISCNDSNYVDDKLIFRYNEHANISSLDPAFSSTLRNIGPVNQIFNGLIKLDDSLNISGDLAKKWFISKNGLEYRFVIKKNIKFHKSVIFGKDSTRSVDAYDFEYSFKRLIDPNFKSAERNSNFSRRKGRKSFDRVGRRGKKRFVNFNISTT